MQLCVGHTFSGAGPAKPRLGNNRGIVQICLPWVDLTNPLGLGQRATLTVVQQRLDRLHGVSSPAMMAIIRCAVSSPEF